MSKRPSADQPAPAAPEVGMCPRGTRVLVAGGNATLRQVLADHLRMHGSFVTAEAGTGAETLAQSAAGSFELYLIDGELPDLDSGELCRRIRRTGVSAPIVLVTAGDSEAETLMGFGAGADDCIARPFRLSVLVARMRAQLRRHARSEESVYPIGPYQFSPDDKQLFDRSAARRIRLTERETAFLKFLLRSDRQPVKRELLLDQVWGFGKEVRTHAIETHVYRLRRKIERDPANPVILVKESGGYRLIL